MSTPVAAALRNDRLRKAFLLLPPGSHALAATLVAALVAVGLHAAGVGSARLLDALPASQQAVHAPPVATAPVRCSQCGHIAGLRLVEAVGEVPASYEFTVRMKDGSTRVSSAPTAGQWRVDDAIILIGGEQPAAGKAP